MTDRIFTVEEQHILDIAHAAMEGPEAFDAYVEAQQKRKLKVGDPDHPINVESIKQHLGCVPEICEVFIDDGYGGDGRYSPYHGMYVIRHTMPAHDRIYTVYDRRGLIESQKCMKFDQYNNQISLDPYMLDRYGDADKIAQEIVKRMRYEWNEAWPHHA